MFLLNYKKVFIDNKDDINKFEFILQEYTEKYLKEKNNKIISEKLEKDQLLGGTLRLNISKFQPY